MIDIRTAFFFFGFASIVFALLLLTTKKSSSKHIISVLTWAKLAQGISFLLLSGRGAIHPLLSINVGVSLLFTGFALDGIAAWLFVGRTRWKEVVLPSLVVSILIMNTTIIAGAPNATRVAVASFIVAILMILSSIAFLQGGSNSSRLKPTIGIADLVVAMANIAGGAAALLSPESGLPSHEPVQFLLIGSLILFMITNGFGFLLLIKEEDDHQLKKSDERYRSMFAGNTAVKLVIDLETGLITDANEAAAAFYGYHPDRLRGMSIREIDHLDRKDLAIIVGISKEDEGHFFRQHHLAKGEVRDVEVYTNPFESGDKRLIMSIIHDVTNRKRAEDALQNSHSLLVATLESTKDGILVVDAAGKVVSFNQSFLQLWRIPETLIAMPDDEKLLQFLLDQLMYPDEFLNKVREVYQSPEESYSDELVFKDGRVFERYSKPQRILDTIVGRVWSFRDITERKRAENALRESEKRCWQQIEMSAFRANRMSGFDFRSRPHFPIQNHEKLSLNYVVGIQKALPS